MKNVLFFDLNKLEKQAKSNAILFISILEDYYNQKTLGNSYIRNYTYKSISGNSFLLNPLPIFNTNIDKSYIVQYVKLAARRDYSLYTLFQVKYLDLSYFPEINLEIIKRNPLLKIINNKIHFKFEEN